MEQLLHYIWKHKLFPLASLTSCDGEVIEVIDVGLHNTDAGPDFFNAKVKIGGTLWVGNVELHCKASDWYTHKHDSDSRYNNVILHVVEVDDARATTSDGRTIPQIVLSVPKEITANYEELLHTDRYPPCYRLIPTLSKLVAHSWMATLQVERLQQKTGTMTERAARCNDSWEQAYFMTLARNFGFGINGDAFETWASGGWIDKAAHHRDNLLQVEALFIGQAGLLEPEAISPQVREAAVKEDYYLALKREYDFLRRKFALQPMDFRLWKFLRLRPQNFPFIRLSQLANLFHWGRTGLSRLVECETIEDVRRLMQTSVSPYWRTHYTFGKASRECEKSLSAQSIELITINTLVPTLFAYGRYRSEENLCQRATAILEQLKPEANNIVRMWSECGFTTRNAADSQALIQLKRQYCDRKDCLRCRIGYEYLKRKSL